MHFHTPLAVLLHGVPSLSCLLTQISIHTRTQCTVCPLPPCSVSPPVDDELEPAQTSAPSGQAGEPSTSQQAKTEKRTAGGAGEQANTAKVHRKKSFCGVGAIRTRYTLSRLCHYFVCVVWMIIVHWFCLLSLDRDKTANTV